LQRQLEEAKLKKEIASARMLTGDHPTVAHELSCLFEAREFSDFGHNRHRTNLSDPTQRL